MALIATIQNLVILFGHLSVVEMAVVQLLYQRIDLDATIVYTLKFLAVARKLELRLLLVTGSLLLARGEVDVLWLVDAFSYGTFEF